MHPSAAALRDVIRAPRRSSAGLVLGIVHVGLYTLCVLAWTSGWWPLGVALWPVLVWMNHASLALLHEAGHGLLSPVRWLNEVRGIIIGTFALIPLSVYRYVHARHHAHLGRERDPEFWPYNLPCASRALRVTYAWLELVAGWLVTPLLYSIRTTRSWTIVPRRQRTRIVLEWGIIVVTWATILAVVAARGWWTGFALGVLVPLWGAGIFQTLRKFTEHLGMHGDSILAMTRTVGYRGPVGRAASRSQYHVDHHGTHHRFARIPFYDLPRATEIVYGDPDAEPLFRSHFAAMADMLPHLLDPKVGPQWRETREVP